MKTFKLHDFLLLNEIFDGYCEHSMRGLHFHLIINCQFFDLAMIFTRLVIRKLLIDFEISLFYIFPCTFLYTFFSFLKAINLRSLRLAPLIGCHSNLYAKMDQITR